MNAKPKTELNSSVFIQKRCYVNPTTFHDAALIRSNPTFDKCRNTVEDHYLAHEITSSLNSNFGSFKGQDVFEVTDVTCTVN